ncbi:MAG TPA: 5'-nucleotidase C-terminal domain-containing protein [Mesorhizobium sp.]|jgi:5'-nucleotidase|nr:5'-nucleotidase C-terminal domain-containing protein [Mesorhizobium sp.]
MKRILSLFALSVSASALSAGAAQADYTLNILHINDWHSRIEGNNSFDSTCSAEEEEKGECFGGAARLVTAIADRRNALQGQNVLVLNAGDNFQGSLFYTTLKGAAETEFLNRIGFDAITLGNHEFDDGEEALVPFLQASEAPVLGANVETTEKFPAADRIKPSVVVEIGGEKIGIVGVVTTDTADIASPGPNLSFSDDVQAVTEEVEKLEAQGVNKIIALTHVGYVRDRDTIAKIPGVDVVVGGHSHTLLSNTAEGAEGPYPTMVENPGGYSVPVVQAYSYSRYLGDLAVTFDDSGRVKSAQGEPILLGNAVKQDEAALARVRELGAPIEELKNRQVAEAADAIDGSRETCRAQECEMGNLITDAMIDRTKDQGVTIAIQNGGGIRASIDGGPVTMGEVLTVLPFQNTLATFQLSGADLVASLEAGVSAIEEGKGKFPQVGGLRYALDPSKPPNAGRVSNVEVMENGAYQPIDPDKLYTVATNNFVRGGGDDYEIFETKAQNAYDFGPSLEQVVADYLAANAPYQPKIEGRITLAQAAQPEQPAQLAAEPAEVEAEPAAPAAASGEAATPATEETITLPELPAASNEIANEPPVAEPAAPAAETPAEPAPAEPAASDIPAAETPAETAPPAADAEPVLPELPAGSNAITSEPPATDAPVSQEPAAPAESAPAEAAPAQATEPAQAEPSPAEPMPAEAPAEPAPADAAQPAEATAAPPSTYVVVAGDNLWEIAERLYGDAERWKDIVAANPGFDPNELAIGMTLNLPPAN